jgi:hypothetical protein
MSRPGIAHALCFMVYSSRHARRDSLATSINLCYKTMATSHFRMPSWLFFTTLAMTGLSIAQETFTNAECMTAVPAMNSCAKRWDSIRTECINANTVNTVWPGPCECAYFANDLPCFDNQALCVRPLPFLLRIPTHVLTIRIHQPRFIFLHPQLFPSITFCQKSYMQG